MVEVEADGRHLKFFDAVRKQAPINDAASSRLQQTPVQISQLVSRSDKSAASTVYV